MSKTTILIILLTFLMNNYSGSAVSLVPADKRTEKTAAPENQNSALKK